MVACRRCLYSQFTHSSGQLSIEFRQSIYLGWEMIRIVIIDDETDARDKMIKVVNFQSFGISVIGTADNGDDAYNLIYTERPNVALIDIEMPGLSGLEVIQKVREQNIPTAFVIISSHSDFSYAQRAITMGVIDYLTKPFLPRDLILAIHKAVKQLSFLNFQAANSLNLPETGGYVALGQSKTTVYPSELEQSIIQAVLAGDTDQAEKTLKLFFAECAKNNTLDNIRNCYIALYLELLDLIQKKRIEIPDDISYSDNTQAVSQRADFVEYLTDLTIRLSSVFSKKSLSENVVLRAERYIQEHYKENITLNSVAQAIYVSPNYLSSLFMRNMNMHFTDVVQNVRIQKAIELIRNNPQMKNYEIAEEVGFHSFKYFSTVFSKVMGMSATQYRMKNHVNT